MWCDRKCLVSELKLLEFPVFSLAQTNQVTLQRVDNQKMGQCMFTLYLTFVRINKHHN